MACEPGNVKRQLIGLLCRRRRVMVYLPTAGFHRLRVPPGHMDPDMYLEKKSDPDPHLEKKVGLGFRILKNVGSGFGMNIELYFQCLVTKVIFKVLIKAQSY